jgi:TonB family protein
LIEALIDTQGRVARALVIHSVPLLDNAALQACCQWVFQPAMKHGRPVTTIIHMPVSFRINTAGPQEQEQRKQRPASDAQ